MSGSDTTNKKTRKDNFDDVYNFSIDYYTNIPNDKVHNLKFKDIQYSNESNNSGSSQDKVYYSKSRYANLESVSNKNDIKKILSNEKKFKLFIKNNYTAIKKTSNDIDSNRIYMDYISSLFTTFPKTDNIKSIKNMQEGTSRGLKMDNPFASNIFTYLNVNGTPHTVSRVVIYDDNKKDKANKTIIDEYAKYKKWRSNETNKNIVDNGMINKINELITDKSKIYNLHKLFLEKEKEEGKETTKIDKIILMLDTLIQKKEPKGKKPDSDKSKVYSDIYLELKNIRNDMNDIKNLLAIFDNVDLKSDETKSKISGYLKKIYDIIRDINISKTSPIIDKKLLSSQKITNLKTLLQSFVEHAEIYETYKDETYDKSILKYDMSERKELKPFIKFIKMIQDKYNPNISFELKDLEDKLKDGTLYDISRDDSFDSASLRIHIDLIKGKVNAENKNDVICYFNDNDLKERWDKLMNEQVFEEELEYLPYFDIDSKNKPDKKEDKPDKEDNPDKKEDKSDKQKKGGKHKTKKKYKKNNRITRRK
jgi:hypothetical protein